ncbi:ester cyclase [Kitasatospora sp. NPDC058032]|uniref:ester cyclase n=1 Tax=Kitasatospora sp. NPDC058032 TaxID=3346307 RepID=UPI0036DD7C64
MPESPATTLAHVATLRRLHDAVNSGDPELIAATVEQVAAPDLLLHTPVPPTASGPRALEQVFDTLRRAFPDLRVTVEDVIAEEDKVVSRNTVTGTNLGEYLGRPPTGHSVTYHEIFVFRFADGRIAEAWGVVDLLAQLRQLGFLPS